MPSWKKQNKKTTSCIRTQIRHDRLATVSSSIRMRMKPPWASSNQEQQQGRLSSATSEQTGSMPARWMHGWHFCSKGLQVWLIPFYIYIYIHKWNAGFKTRPTPVGEALSCQRSASCGTLNVELSAACVTVIKVLVTLIKSQCSCFVPFFCVLFPPPFLLNSCAFHFCSAS